MKNIRYKINSKWLVVAAFMVIGFSSCTDDLVKNPTNDKNSEQQFSTVEGYKQAMISTYSTLVYGPFLRFFWQMQEQTTDEAVNTWNDQGEAVYHQLNWSADVPCVGNVYSAMLSTITYSNNFIKESTAEKIAKRGFNTTDAATISRFNAEMRFIRAYSYWVLMDLYANPPFPTEENVGGEAPKQILRKDLFSFIESELKAIEPQLADARTNEYGRADKAAAWSLLARIYLNAYVYTGIERNTDAVTYSKKVINANYSLEKNSHWLLLGDNHLNTNEFIFTLNYDNALTRTWNGTNFLALGAANIPESINGLSGSWNNFRMTQQLADLFPSADTLIDKRAQFFTTGQKKEVTDMGVSTDGYSSYKYRNLTRSGNKIVQNNSFNNLSDIDFPIFRLAEIYFTYAEAVLRGGSGGDVSTALSYINKLRGRAYANNPASSVGNIAASQLNLNFILDEKAREMYWEAQRRTDLIRYNRLTSADYLWAWKGNVIGGTGVDSKYNIFPLPTSDLLANPNLKQNANY